jgi:hypothetical protein
MVIVLCSGDLKVEEEKRRIRRRWRREEHGGHEALRLQVARLKEKLLNILFCFMAYEELTALH